MTLKMKWPSYVLLSLMVFPFTGWAQDLPYLDEEFGCVEESTADQYISDFNINFRSFGGKELCDSKVDSKKLFNDFEIVRLGQFSGDQTNEFIGNFVDRDKYYSWLISMTRGIRRGHDLPYATAYNSGGYFTMQDGWSILTTLGRVGVLIHEARHTAGYGHIPCTQGPYKDAMLRGCDRTLKGGGSHAVEMEYYSRVVLQGSNFHPVYKSMARLMNLARANFVFNEGSLTHEDVLAGHQVDQVVLTGSDKVQGPITLPEELKSEQFEMKRSSAGVTLFNGDRAFSLDFYDGGETEGVLKEDLYTYYKLILGERIRALDFEEFDIANKRYVVALGVDGQLYIFNFPDGEFSRGISLPRKPSFLSTTSPDGKEGLFIVYQDGSIQSFDPERRQLRDLNFTWPEDIHQFVNYKGSLLGLNVSGEAFEIIENDRKAFSPFEGLELKGIQKAPIFRTFIPITGVN